MVVYATYEHNDKVTDHFAGIYPVRIIVGTSLSAGNIMKFLEKYFLDQSVDLMRA